MMLRHVFLWLVDSFARGVDLNGVAVGGGVCVGSFQKNQNSKLGH
jgi:hypothetical protein